MRKQIARSLLAAVMLAAVSAQPTTAASDKARALAATCFTCHGTDGVSVGEVPPSLAGLDRDYLRQQLTDFKSGRRPSTIMQQHARGYSDAQLERIADYFSSVKPVTAVAAPRAAK